MRQKFSTTKQFLPETIILNQCSWQLEEDEKSAGRCCLLV
jgi:hypothetical protein